MLIAFDLDDTLIDTSGAVTPYKLRQFAELLIARGCRTSYEELTSLNRGTLSSKETIRIALEKLGAMHLFEEALALYTAPLPEGFAIPQTPHAKKVLQTLQKRKGVLLAIVTGGKPAFQLEKLKKAGLEASIFSKIAVPEDSQKKPHYEALLRDFSVLPRDAIAVGDRIPMDLLPAHELGYRTVHMRWGRGLMGKREDWIDHSIQELTELLEWV